MTIQKSKNKTQKRIFGDRGENIACGYLVNQGYKIVKKNFGCKYGEIDIIAKKNDVLVFVEVKTRKNNLFGEPQEFVNYNKLERMNMTIDYFLSYYKVKENYIFRIDVIEIIFNELNNKYKINHIEDFNN